MAIAAMPTVDETERPIFVFRSRAELEDIAAREPHNPMPLYLLANVLRRAGDPSWRDVTAAARERPHIAPQHIYARSLVRIQQNDWGGWTDYRMRFRGPETIRDLLMFSDICWKHQEWDGTEDLTGRSMVVLPEQGLGDCLQMWRFIPWLLERGCNPILMSYPRLVALARHNFGDRAKVWLHDVKPTVPFDRYVWSMSLPAIAGGLPPFRPLRAPGRRPRLPRRARPVRAGLCWAGSPNYLHDPDRSMPLADLESLLSRSEVEWTSLQVGPRASEGDPYALHTPSPPLASFADTADLLSDLDYIVTVDTSVAHLAGLLGLPTYLLLQHDSHWRWGLGGTTPWYPSMRLIRQHTFGDWPSAVRELAAILDEAMENSRLST
jgi:hypothetical protein